MSIIIEDNKVERNLAQSHFLGNPLLRPAGTPMSVNPEQMEEYLRCSESPEYFVRNYIKIVTLDNGLVPFEPYSYQIESINLFNENRFVVVKQPRQSGKTTTYVGFAVWSILFHSEYTIAIVANKMDTAQGILGRLETAYENLPKWMQQGVITWNKRSVELENGSKVFCAPTSVSGLRSESVNCLIMDELAHIDGHLQAKFFESTYPIITAGKTTKVIIVSTPNGMDMFFKIWSGAIHKQNEYVPFEVHWWDTPGRDEKWKKETIRNTSQRQFDQEYVCRFLGSADTLLDADTLERLSYVPPIRRMQENVDIKIFKEPQADHEYLLVADTARGVNGDFSAFVVVDIDTNPYEVVASYHDNTIKPELFAHVLNHVGLFYNNAFILAENNDLGEMVLSSLNDLEYENLLVTSLMKGKTGITLGGQGDPKSVKLGVKTTPSVKRRGCFALKGLIENNKLLVSSEDIVDELCAFVKNTTGSFAAQTGHKDDLTMCLVLFAWASTYDYFRDTLGHGKSHWDRIKSSQNKDLSEQMLTFGYDNGTSDDPDLTNPVNMIDFGYDDKLPSSSWWEDTNLQDDPDF